MKDVVGIIGKHPDPSRISQRELKVWNNENKVLFMDMENLTKRIERGIQGMHRGGGGGRISQRELKGYSFNWLELSLRIRNLTKRIESSPVESIHHLA